MKNIYKTFDYLGFPAFLYLFIDSLINIIQGSFDWRVIARLIITFIGMIIDGYLIFIHKDNSN